MCTSGFARLLYELWESRSALDVRRPAGGTSRGWSWASARPILSGHRRCGRRPQSIRPSTTMYCLRTHIVDDGTRKRTRPHHTMTVTSDHTPASAPVKEVRSPRRYAGAVIRLVRRVVLGTVAAVVLAMAGAGTA